MTFTCTYCEKPINCVPILIDKTHFLHPQCEEAFNKNKKWAGFLEGVKGLIPSEIADKYECCKSTIIK